MKLLIITQKVDQKDDLLGFFVGWLREFSKHFEYVSVIALGVGSYELPKNVAVYSCGKERGVWRPFRWARFLWLLITLIPHSSGVFAHMSPAFALAAWPFTFLFHKRLVLWYLHRSSTLRLRLGVLLSDALVTADIASLTIRDQKIVSVGHGIDIQRFTVTRNWSEVSSRPLHILSAGRLSPIKDFGTLIRAAVLLRKRNIPIDVRIVGRSVMPGDYAYEKDLRELVITLGAEDIVHFIGFVPYHDMPAQYAWADIVVGCTPRGGIDKTLLEAMAAGSITITSNEIIGKYLDQYADQLLFKHNSPDNLAEKITLFNELPWETKRGTSDFLIQSVSHHHQLGDTISRISQLL